MPSGSKQKWGYVLTFALLFILLSGASAVASHFKGGQITYRYMGSGQYDIFIKSYWDKAAVGNINLLYQGAPKLNTPSVTLSKTLLPDGQTIEHYQKQTVTWSQPGLYAISWRSCCRAVGSNFGNNENGLFAAVNFDPTVPSSSPQFYDFPIFNFSTDNRIQYNLNMEDADGHEQEYSLEVPYGVPGDPYKLMRESGFSITNDGTVSWERPLKGLWLVNVKLREKINGSFTGAYILRDFILNISSSANAAPAFEPVPAQTVKEGQTISFNIKAVDEDGQSVTLISSGSAYEKGASFTKSAQDNTANGTFTWTPAAGMLGKYNIQFIATDSDIIPLSSQMTVAVTVVSDICEVQASGAATTKPCTGLSNGKIELAGSNGTAPYAYSLNGGQTFQSASLFENLAAGNYTAVVKDATGCVSSEQQITLLEDPLPSVTFALPASTVCVGATAVRLSGGNPAGGSYSGTGVKDGVFNPAVAGTGTHTILYTYTNSSGCSSSATQFIVVNATPVANAGADKTTFYGYKDANCATLSATATGGSASYTYRWSTGATTQTLTVCPTATTTYTVTVTDASGCSSTDEVTVFVTDVRCGNKMDKVLVCHNGHEICIAPAAVKAHLAHGDVLGSCNGRTESPAVAAQAMSVFPNPMGAKAQLTLKLQEQDYVTLEILDMNGKVVKKLYQGTAAANKEQSFDIKRSIGNQQLYIARLTTSKGTQFIKIMLAN
ncbi:hypothetical protein GCM10023188_03200 [Pontibacter saemangeumensis]|uniref:Secretion system C-terminal sorting domain-containing protein n=1 Tax=Pontibacter saemangeumensis TaxID=1084525 RepID=A0ABP8L813_9BACT